jgi:hypothetical protein
MSSATMAIKERKIVRFIEKAPRSDDRIEAGCSLRLCRPMCGKASPFRLCIFLKFCEAMPRVGGVASSLS